MTFFEIHWTTESAVPLLGILQLLPALAAIPLLFMDRRLLQFALTIGLVEMGLAIYLLQFPLQGENTLHLVERLSLLGPLAYHAGVDGIGALFMLLAAFLCLMVMLYGALVRHFQPINRFLGVVLLNQSLIMAQFAAVDLLWFTLLSLVQILLAGHLLQVWATSPAEGPMVIRFYQFMGLGLFLLFLAALLLGWEHAVVRGGIWRFDLVSLTAISLPPTMQSVLFYLLLYGFAMRIPMFPFHAWLPMVAEHGTVASAMVLLLGLKTGVYGLVRFLFPLLPDAVLQWQPYVVAIASAGIFHSALLALVQQNLRRLIAYAVVSHTGIMIIGLFSLDAHAFQGSILMAVNFGLAVSTLLFALGMVFLRTKSVLLPKMGGLFDRLPVVAIAFLWASISIAGMPITPGFDAVHLMLEATIHRFGALVTITAAMGNVAAVACLLWAFQRAFLSPPHASQPVIDRATRVETGFVAVMVLVQVMAGIFSENLLQRVEQACQGLARPYHITLSQNSFFAREELSTPGGLGGGTPQSNKFCVIAHNAVNHASKEEP